MKRQKISAEDAVYDILQFVYNAIDDEDDQYDLNQNENEGISSLYRKCHTKYLINRTDGKKSLEGRNISFDHLYTSCYLYWNLWLQTEKLHQKISRKLITGKSLRQNSIRTAQMISSRFIYCQFFKEEKGERDNPCYLQALSWHYNDSGKNKAMLCKLYDFNKGGTNIVDQQMESQQSEIEKVADGGISTHSQHGTCQCIYVVCTK